VDRDGGGAASRYSITTSESATYTRMLEAAATLFREKGYAGATTRELAALVGIQNASLYHHIRGKADLLYKLCVESLRTISEAVDAALAGSGDPVTRLRALVLAHVTTALAEQDMHATMLAELRSLPPQRREEVVRLRDRYEATVRKVISEGQAAGLIRRDMSARYLTLALLNLLNWTIFWFNPDGRMTAQELASVFASIYLDGVLAPATESFAQVNSPSRIAKDAQTAQRSQMELREKRASRK
jgi:AcrR family transcriptional regulator